MPPALRMRYPFFPSIVRVLAKQLAEEPTELIHTQAQAGAHGAERQAQLRGSFAARQPAPEDQLDHLALGLRQRRQGHADLAPQPRDPDTWLLAQLLHKLDVLRRGEWPDHQVIQACYS